jgi:hypothetical protein
MASRVPNLLIASTAIAIATGSRSVRGDEPFGLVPTDVSSAFFIAKSQNRNQVHYGVHVDRNCRPVGDAPVFAYWRMLEKRGQLEPLLDREVPAYGLREDQRVEVTNPGRTTIRVSLRALPERPLRLTVARTEAGCQATTATTIAGTDAQLKFVYVRLAWLLGIDYLLLRGNRFEGGTSIQEVVRR